MTGHSENRKKTLPAVPALFLLLIFVAVCTAAHVSALEPAWEKGSGGDTIASMSLTPDGKRLAVGTTGGDLLMFSNTSERLWTENRQGTQLVRIIPNSTFLIAGSQDELYSNKGAVRFFSNGTVYSVMNTGWVSHIGVSWALNRSVIGTKSGIVLVIDPEGNTTTLTRTNLVTDPVAALSISKDGYTIAYSTWSDKKPQLIVITGKPSRRYGYTTSYVVNHIAISANGSAIVSAEGEGSAGSLSLRSNTGRLEWTNKVNRTTALKVGKNASVIVTGHENGIIRAFDQNGTPLWNFTADAPVTTLAMTPTAYRIVAGTGAGSLYFLNVSGNMTGLFKYQDVLFNGISHLEIADDGSAVAGVINHDEILYFRLEPEPVPVFQRVNTPPATPLATNKSQAGANVTLPKTPMKGDRNASQNLTPVTPGQIVQTGKNTTALAVRKTPAVVTSGERVLPGLYPYRSAGSGIWMTYTSVGDILSALFEALYGKGAKIQSKNLTLFPQKESLRQPNQTPSGPTRTNPLPTLRGNLTNTPPKAPGNITLTTVARVPSSPVTKTLQAIQNGSTGKSNASAPAKNATVSRTPSLTTARTTGPPGKTQVVANTTPPKGNVSQGKATPAITKTASPPATVPPSQKPGTIPDRTAGTITLAGPFSRIGSGSWDSCTSVESLLDNLYKALYDKNTTTILNNSLLFPQIGPSGVPGKAPAHATPIRTALAKNTTIPKTPPKVTGNTTLTAVARLPSSSVTKTLQAIQNGSTGKSNVSAPAKNATVSRTPSLTTARTTAPPGKTQVVANTTPPKGNVSQGKATPTITKTAPPATTMPPSQKPGTVPDRTAGTITLTGPFSRIGSGSWDSCTSVESLLDNLYKALYGKNTTTILNNSLLFPQIGPSGVPGKAPAHATPIRTALAKNTTIPKTPPKVTGNTTLTAVARLPSSSVTKTLQGQQNDTTIKATVHLSTPVLTKTLPGTKRP